MKLRKILALMLTASIAVASVACVGQKPAETTAETTAETKAEVSTEKKVPVVGMITDIGGVNDKSFNQSAYEGLKKAQDEGLITLKYLESTSDADYEKHVNTFVEEEVDVILGIGFKLEETIYNAALEYPETKFAVIDAALDGGKGVVPANAEGSMFQAHEGAFLGGYLAALTTETNKLGLIIGVDAPILNAFATGFYAGAWTHNPEIQIFGQYANSFADVAKGKNLAEQMYSQDADIIYSAAGDTGNGAIESAKERNKWAIGVDRDQYELAPENMLTSTMKRVDIAVYNIASRISKGEEFGGKTVYYGMQEGAVGLSPSTQNITPENLKLVEEMAAKLQSGEVTAPATIEDLIKLFPEAEAKFMK